MSTERETKALMQGYFLALNYIKSGVSSWELIKGDVNDVARIEKDTKLTDLLEDGNIRTHIQSHLDIKDITRSTIRQSDLPLDVMMQLNNGDSKAFQELMEMASKTYWENIKKVITSVPIKDKQGNITGTMEFDINTADKTGRTLFFTLVEKLIKNNFDTNRYYFYIEDIRECFKLGTVNPNIPVTFRDGSVMTAFSILVHMYCRTIFDLYEPGHRISAKLIWEIIEKIIKEYPLQTLYLPENMVPKGIHGRIYALFYDDLEKWFSIHDDLVRRIWGIKVYVGWKRYVVVNNTMLAMCAPPEKIPLLKKQGFDIMETGNGKSYAPDILYAMEKAIKYTDIPKAQSLAAAALQNWEKALSSSHSSMGGKKSINAKKKATTKKQ
jgi:hypothetical protein